MNNLSKQASKLEALLFSALLVIIFCAPLPFGSNRPWAAAFLAALIMCLVSIWLVGLMAGAIKKPARVWLRAKWPLVLLMAVQAWLLIQILPLPQFIVSLVSPHGAQVHQLSGLVPLSLDISATCFYLIKSLSYAGGFVLVVALVNSKKKAELLMWTIVLSGLFQTVYGSLMVLTGVEWGFFVEKYVGKGVATGTFVNRNHLAGYLVICLSTGTGLLLSQLATSSQRSLKALLRYWLALLLSKKILLRVCLALMVIGLVLTRSRMGNMSFFVSLGVAGVIALAMGRTFSRGISLLIISLFVIDVWIVGQWFGFDKVVERLEKTKPVAENVRVEVTTSGGSILGDYPLTGSGGGSFYGIFGHYQNPGTKGYYDHAHNDYLEIAGDLGIPVLLILGVFIGLTAIRAITIQRDGRSRLQKGVGFSTCMAISWFLMHSSVDFNLQIPANALTFCVILGLCWADYVSKHDIRENLVVKKRLSL